MTAPVDFTTFCDDLLPDWSNDQGLIADDEATSARHAAKLALYRAALADGKGTIVVVAPSHEQKTVQGFIEAMVESQPLLRGTEARIEVATRERAALIKDPSRVIALVQSEGRVRVEDIDLRDMARSIFDVARQGPAAATKMEELVGLPRGFFSKHDRGVTERMREKWDWQHENKPSTLPNTLPPSLHPRALEFGVPTALVDGADDYFSPEWEEANAARKMSGGHRKPVVRHSRPGSDR